MVDTLTTAQPSWAAMVGTSKSVSGVQNIMRKHHSQRGGVDVRFRRKWRKCKIARAAHRHWVGGTPQALAQVLDPTNPRSASRGGRQIAVEDGENRLAKERFRDVRGLSNACEGGFLQLTHVSCSHPLLQCAILFAHSRPLDRLVGCSLPDVTLNVHPCTVSRCCR